VSGGKICGLPVFGFAPKTVFFLKKVSGFWKKPGLKSLRKIFYPEQAQIPFSTFHFFQKKARNPISDVVEM
jgi:hypothetical protein